MGNEGRRARRGARHVRDEQGVALIEFALVLPLTLLILFGLIDFGFIFNGYNTLRNGVQAGARLASDDQYQYGGTATCSGTDPTSQMICSVVAGIGTLFGTQPGTLKVGISITSASVHFQTGGQNVTVCASAGLNSTSGLLYRTFLGETMSSSSTLFLAQTPSYSAYGPQSSVVTYDGTPVPGMSCSA